ncbi:hypothetical protein [Kibdelosporangium persicum]|nr:hypothetical protein [Kibdelosporangium persicum]
MATALVIAGCTSQNVAAPTSTATSGPVTASSAASTRSPATSDSQPQVGSGIPANLLLPNENEGSTSPGATGWKTDNTIGQPWLLDPCRPTTYPTDSKRVAFRSVSRTGPELRQARQLAAFPSADVAAETVSGFRRVLSACKTGGNASEGNAWQWVSEDVRIGDDGFVAAGTVGGPAFSPSGTRIAVTRVGSLVFLAYDEGEYSSAQIDGGARKTQQVAEQFAASK